MALTIGFADFDQKTHETRTIGVQRVSKPGWRLKNLDNSSVDLEGFETTSS